METLQVEEREDSKRLDIVLASHQKVASRSEAQRIIKSGKIKINASSEKISPKLKVKRGDLIEFTVIPPASTDILPVAKPLDIQYEDDYLIIINKPSGMVVHPSAGHYNDTLVNYLLYHTTLSDKDPVRPGIVHRIDKDTSGLLVVAKDNRTHDNLAKQFFHHTIERTYEALVWGTPEQPVGKIDKPLGRHPSDRKKFAVREHGKNAVTHWKTVLKLKYLSLIQCRLETGRTHQIRVHLSSVGHPLLGDKVYGRYRNYANKLSKDTVKLLKQREGQALHAKSLAFQHPKEGKWIRFEIERPEYMNAIIKAMQEELEGFG